MLGYNCTMNISRLREKVSRLEKGEGGARNDEDSSAGGKMVVGGGGLAAAADEPDAFEAMLKSFTKKNALKTRKKLKQHTSKIVSSFRPPALTAALVKEYRVGRCWFRIFSISNNLPYFFPIPFPRATATASGTLPCPTSATLWSEPPLPIRQRACGG